METEAEDLKRCSECRACKPRSEFNKNKARADGLDGKCRPCANARLRAWRKSNPESQAKSRRKQYEKNKNREFETHRLWWERNLNNEEYHKKRKRTGQIYYLRNREAYIQRAAEWNRRHKDKVRQIALLRKTRLEQAPGDCSEEIWNQRLAYYGHKCIYCGGPYESIDHAIPVVRGGSKWPANLRPTCNSCNGSKGSRTHKEYLEYLKFKQMVLAESDQTA